MILLEWWSTHVQTFSTFALLCNQSDILGFAQRMDPAYLKHNIIQILATQFAYFA